VKRNHVKDLGMDILWAPWRMQYILSSKPDECVFCLPENNSEDEQRFVLHRGKHMFVIINKFPYNAGHLMVTPYRHVMDICDLNVPEYTELFDLSQKSVAILRNFSSPQGFNLGFNIGDAAGAGIKEHVHFHIVPRWNGDSSFMAVLGEVRTVPEHLQATYARLKPYFDRLSRV
jgi:ATP adenylyltransferase